MPSALVYVSADDGGWGIEVKQPKGDLVMTAPSDLGLSPCLCSDLRHWQGWFDGVFHLCYQDLWAVLGDRFDLVGKQLAERVAKELGAAYHVEYQPQGGWRRASPGEPVAISCKAEEPGQRDAQTGRGGGRAGTQDSV